MLIPSFSVMSFAEDPVHLSMSDETVYAGDEFTLNLFISDNSKVSGAVIDIAYDDDYFQFVSAKEGAILDADANISIKNFNKDNSYVRLTYLSSSSSILSSGILLSVTFSVKEDAEGESELKISIPNPGDFISSDLTKIPYTIKNSKVTVIRNSNFVDDLTEEQSSDEITDEVDNGQTDTDEEAESSVQTENEKDTNKKNDKGMIIIAAMLMAGIAMVAVGLVFIFKKKK